MSDKIIDKIIEIIKKRYSADDRGCYINGKWFSPAEIIELLNTIKEEF